jgi:ribosomal protein S18 acetylase RimI-like enzyme
MAQLEIRAVGEDDVEVVAALWTRCGLTRPWNDPFQDIAFARASDNATILLALRDGEPVASAMVGHDGHRGTVYYVCVDPGCRNEGLGRAIMEASEDWLRACGVWKLNLIVRAENRDVIDFYEALGYAVEERVNLAKWIDPSKKPS